MINEANFQNFAKNNTQNTTTIKQQSNKTEEKVQSKEAFPISKSAALAIGSLALASISGIAYIHGKKTSAKLQQKAQEKIQKLTQQLTDSNDKAKKLAEELEKQKNKLLFPFGIDKLHFRQTNNADCYLLSSIFSLSRNKKGQEIIRDMVKMNDDCDFIVTFKGVGKQYLIKASEITGGKIL